MFNIGLLLNKEIFLSGDTVIGTIEINLIQNVQPESLFLIIKGTEKSI